MKTRDFINIGVFTAIYFVLAFGLGMLGIVAVPMMFVGYALGIIANGVVVSLFKSRVPHIGALAIMGFLVALLMMLTGHPWIIVIIAPILGLIGDFCYAQGKPFMNMLGYAVLSLWYVVPWLPVLYDVQGYRQYIVDSMGTEYANSLDWFLSPTMILLWAVAIFILGLIGGAFGESVIKRHFRRSEIAK